METLFIVACVANPLRWQSRIALARAAVADWLKEPNVHVTLAECAYGSRGHDLSDLAGPRITHLPLRATTMAWSKECLLNIAIAHLPPAAEKIVALDADVTFRRSGWATEALAALDLYPVIQPWDTAYDLGPHDEHIQTHKSFAAVWHAGKPVVATGTAFWSFNGGYNVYPHPGYAWGWQRRVLDRIGGLLETGAMGSGDYHMALGLIGRYEASLPAGASEGYKNSVASWAVRTAFEINGKLGFAHGTIEHPFHGRKADRGYQTRWQMFLDTGFDPATDIKRNTYGVLEFSGTKPDLERAFDRYLRAREEDVNTLT
jgi:hypothetical protein